MSQYPRTQTNSAPTLRAPNDTMNEKPHFFLSRSFAGTVIRNRVRSVKRHHHHRSRPSMSSRIYYGSVALASFGINRNRQPAHCTLTSTSTSFNIFHSSPVGSSMRRTISHSKLRPNQVISLSGTCLLFFLLRVSLLRSHYEQWQPERDGMLLELSCF